MALRKLQAEIDRTLKLVTLGNELFDETFAKLEHASNATQKEKLEQDLKTQIKKLQRMRDQIKVWLGNSDIKDKSALLEGRKSIEGRMERFKALEKEMKMKAFSKEGLIAAARLDPVEKAKREMIDWIGSTTDELSRQIEQTEAEAEQLQVGKKKKSTTDRLAELDQLNERRQWHIGRLEIVQRMFENGQLSFDQVEMIQEDVKYFVEANTEEDFDYDVGIYDELNLQDVEDDYIADYGHNAEESSNLDSASLVDEPASFKTPSKEEKKSKSHAGDDTTPPSPVQSKRGAKKSEKEKEKAEAAKAAASAKVETPAPTPPAPTSVPSKPVALPPIRYAAAAAAAVGGATEVGSSRSRQDSTPLAPEESQEESEEQSVIDDVSTTPERTQSNGDVAPPPGLSASPSPVPQEMNAQASSSSGANGGDSQQAPSAPESSRAASGYSTSPRKEQGVLENLMQSFGVAKDLAERRANDPNELHSSLDVSYHNAPSQLDAEPPRYYHPSNPIATPSYYPQSRLHVLEDKNIYQRLELDQLFYIFYYMTGTYEQWLAAQELKRQSWRFHKQYLTWFQRAHNPQAITEDYEQGGYYYFDWENSWCQRRKSDFRFEYRWLSDH